MSNRWLLLLVFAAIFALLASADSLASKRTSDPSKTPDGYLKIQVSAEEEEEVEEDMLVRSEDLQEVQVLRPRPDFQGGGRNATVLDLDDGETEAKGRLPEFLERKPRVIDLEADFLAKEKEEGQEETPGKPALTEEEAVSFSRMLVTILKKEMKNCDIVLAYDDGYRIPAILQELLRLPNPRKLIYVRPSEELPGQAWESSQCRGYVYLLQDLAPLLHLADTRQDAWDFSGKFVVVAPTKAHLEELALSNCGRKTENIAGIAKASGKSEWGVYMNLLYWGAGVARINTWKRGRFTLPLALFPDKLSNLRGVVLEVVTFEWEPSVFYYRNKDGRVLFRYGTDIGVVNALSQVLNFTVAFKEPPKGEYWGREEENGSWSGMMGKLSRNEVDIGVGDLYMTIVRVGILDYTAPYDSELSCFMARTEPPLPRWQALAFPFQGFTWLAIFGGLVLTGPVLYLLARASNCCGEEIACLQSLAYSWYYAVGLHCCEAQVVLPAMKSTRAYVIFLWLYCMIITIAYSTNLTAFLLVTKQPQSMETIRDLHASGIEVSGVGKFYGDALASASDPYLQSLTHRFQDYSLAEPIFRKVLTGDSVMLQNRPYLEFVAATKFTNRGVSRMRLMKVRK